MDSDLSLNLKDISYFVAVVESGLMHRAAERLDISQPALTKAIKRLELHLGEQLFLRSRRGMQPTPFGDEFYSRARSLDGKLREALGELSDLRADAAAMVKVATIAGYERIVYDAFRALRARRPALRVECFGVSLNELLLRIEHGRADMALGPLPSTLANQLEVTELWRESLTVIGRRDHPALRGARGRGISALQRVEWILPSTAVVADFQIDQVMSVLGIAHPRVALRSDYHDAFAIHLQVSASDLLALSSMRWAHHAQTAKVARLAMDFPTSEIAVGIICSRARRPNELAEALKTELQRHAAGVRVAA